VVRSRDLKRVFNTLSKGQAFQTTDYWNSPLITPMLQGFYLLKHRADSEYDELLY